MKIIAKREAILSPLQAVIGVVERRQTMPILANVLLSAKGGRLAVTATDLEVELVATSISSGVVMPDSSSASPEAIASNIFKSVVTGEPIGSTVDAGEPAN